MIKKIKIYILSLFMVVATSCELDLLDNPNVVTQDSVNPDFLLTQVQLNFVNFFSNTTTFGMEMSRMLNSSQRGATYDAMYQPSTFNGTWTAAYSNTLINANTLIPIAEERQFFTHAGIAKVLKAYVLLTLVDYFGDVPFSEALNPEIFNPVADDGQSVHEAAFALLEEAILDFENEDNLANPNDLFYGGDQENWIKFTNSMKLKYHITRRLTHPNAAAINALITGGQLISTNAESFSFRYGSNIANPDSRHPRFPNNYTAGGNDYMHNFYMWHMIEEGPKGVNDPRVRYYFYRQRGTNPTDVNQLSCVGDIENPPDWYPDGMPYCLPSDNRGYWGRDHMDNTGIPPDNLLRTVWGLYPVGGRFDNNSFAPANNITLGNQGQGIWPIMMNSFVDFMLAEAALTLGTDGDAADYLETAIDKSMLSVRAFATGSREASVVTGFQSNAVFTAAKNDYIDLVLNEYANAGSDDARLNIIIREYWLALFGNGVEGYNMYRRTGKPSNPQPAVVVENPGPYYLSLKYPDNYVNRNRNAEPKNNNEIRVYWDDGSAGVLQ
jgi:hypothetical protein